MWRTLLLGIMVAGCVQLPPTPQDIQAKKFERVEDKAVIYLVRDYPDFNESPATVSLDGSSLVTTYPGTYYRWEVAPGTHRIAGYAADSGSITVQTQPGKIYFVQQRVTPLTVFPALAQPQSHFYPIPEGNGRAVVMRGQLVP